MISNLQVWCWHPLLGRSTALGFGKKSTAPPTPTSPHVPLLAPLLICHSQILWIWIWIKHLRSDSLHCRLVLLPKILCLSRLIQYREEKRLEKYRRACSYTHTHACTHTRARFFDVGTELLHSGSPLQQLCQRWMHYHAAVVMCLFLLLALLAQHYGGTLEPSCTIAGLRVAEALLIR